MKFLILFASVVLAVNAATDKELWLEFKQNFGRDYRNLREEQLRFSIFQNNLRTIEQHNEKYAKGEQSYYLGVNQFTDITATEFKSMQNYNASVKPVSHPTVFHKMSGVQAASSLSWVDKGVVTPIKDQGQCGSCWSFSAIGAVEGAYALSTGSLVAFSEQNLIDCDTVDAGCNGGVMQFAFDYIRDNGIESQADYPYTATDGQCQFNSNKAVKISTYVNVPQTEDALLDAVATVGPISVAVYSVPLQMYAGGIFDDSSCNQQYDHGVVVVGYGNADGKDYWLVKNSWGTEWGESGYVRIARNQNNLCDIATDASYPIF